MKEIITLESHFGQFISVNSAKSASDGCEVTLNIPWHVAENIAAMAAPFLQTVTDTLDKRTKEQAKKDVAKKIEAIRRSEENKKWRMLFLSSFKRVYRDGIDYHELLEALGMSGDFYSPHIRKNHLHKLYFDARARKCEQMRKANATNKEIAQHFNINVKSLTAVFSRLNREYKGGCGGYKMTH